MVTLRKTKRKTVEGKSGSIYFTILSKIREERGIEHEDLIRIHVAGKYTKPDQEEPDDVNIPPIPGKVTSAGSVTILKEYAKRYKLKEGNSLLIDIEITKKASSS